MFRTCIACGGDAPPLEAILSGSHTPCVACKGRGVQRTDSVPAAAPGFADASRCEAVRVEGSFHSRIVRQVFLSSRCAVLRDALLSQFQTPWCGSERIAPKCAAPTETVARSDPRNPLGLREVADVAALDTAFLRAAVDPSFVAIVVSVLGDSVNLHSTRAIISAPGDGVAGHANEWRCAAATVHERHAGDAACAPPPPPTVAVAQSAPAEGGSPQFAECGACGGRAPPLAALIAGTHTPCARCDGRGVVRTDIDARGAGVVAASLLPTHAAPHDGASGGVVSAKIAPPAFVALLLHLDAVVPHGGAFQLEVASPSSAAAAAPVAAVEQSNMAVGDVLLVGPHTRHRVGGNAAEEHSKVWLEFVYTRADAVDAEAGGNRAAFATLPVARDGAPCITITLQPP